MSNPQGPVKVEVVKSPSHTGRNIAIVFIMLFALVGIVGTLPVWGGDCHVLDDPCAGTSLAAYGYPCTPIQDTASSATLWAVLFNPKCHQW